MDAGGLTLWSVVGEYAVVYVPSGEVNKTGTDAFHDEIKWSLSPNGCVS